MFAWASNLEAAAVKRDAKQFPARMIVQSRNYSHLLGNIHNASALASLSIYGHICPHECVQRGAQI